MKLAPELLQVFMLLNNESPNNYLVGGCVRDYLTGKDNPKDWDIVTDVHMDKVEEIFRENGWKVDATGKAFMVMNVSKKVETRTTVGDILLFGREITEIVEQTFMVEISNFRKDGYSSDGRRPDSVEIGTMAEDAARRDFTVNSIYYDPIKDKYHAPIEGSMVDIKDKVLRFIGKPKDRIEEDYLRVFRFYRFLTKGFEPETKSLKACRTYFNEAYEKTTPERVRSEIERMV